MTSTVLMQFLLVVYVVIALVSAYEGNWPRMMYWVGAIILSSSILWATNG